LDDDGKTYRRTVTVFDGVKATTFDSDIVTNGCTEGRATAWGVDASAEVMSDYFKWHLSVNLPIQALKVGESAKSQYNKKLDEEIRQLSASTSSVSSVDTSSSVSPTRGQTYRVVRGRKIPIGTTGKVFWVGKTRWGGTTVGLALSDLKDSAGRYIDAVFTSPQNLEYVTGNTTASNSAPVVTADTNDIAIRVNNRAALADAYSIKEAVRWYNDQLDKWIKQTGYDGATVRERLITILTDRINGITNPDLILAPSIALVALKGISL
jgi:hypothetical protein